MSRNGVAPADDLNEATIAVEANRFVVGDCAYLAERIAHYTTESSASSFVGTADTVVVATEDTKKNDNGTFLLSTEAQHGGKQRDGEARTLHGFKIDSPGILSRDNNSSNSLIAYPDPNTHNGTEGNK